MFGTRRAPTNNARKFLGVGAAVAALAYFFDPRMGRTRRAKLQDQIGGLLRRGARETSRKTEYARGHVEGLRHAASSDALPENDATLKDKVESEVLSRWKYPKGQINVTAVDGVVELRGVCDDAQQISDIEAEVRKVTGVVDVRNFLHLPNTPAPTTQGVRDLS